MPRKSASVRNHLEQSRTAALAAVEHYNKPGVPFRTRTYVLLMNIAWTSLFHAIFYQRKIKPWYLRHGSGRGRRYDYVDGEPKHWDLPKCLREYWRSDNPPPRENLTFFIGLRNKIEHRSYPELDPALYGECQAMLMNYEDVLTKEFGQSYALAGELGVALQFSALRTEQQEKAIRRLQSSALSDIREHIDRFRAGLSPEVLESTQYSMRVFLIPKLASKQNAADLSVEFVPFDPSKPEEAEALAKVTTLIRERIVPVVNPDLRKPGQVVKVVNGRLPFVFNQHHHTQAWKHFKVRPEGGSDTPMETNQTYCLYDNLANGYGYTDAWVSMLVRELVDEDRFMEITDSAPKRRELPNQEPAAD